MQYSVERGFFLSTLCTVHNVRISEESDQNGDLLVEEIGVGSFEQ